MNTSLRLAEHYAAYPELCIEDIFKFLFQSAFGCEHFVASYEAALAYIRREAETVNASAPPRIDRLDGSYSRVHLSWLNRGLRPETLARLFCLSARREDGGSKALREKLTIARRLVESGEIPLNPAEFDRKLAAWDGAGYPAIHHSESFRQAYRPAYRVLHNRYAEHIPLLARIDGLMESKPSGAVVVIEGGAASGKTTLAALLQEIYGCSVLHTDDFFLRPAQRTPARLAEIGGNLDRERFLQEVVEPLTQGAVIRYRRFNCMTQALEHPVEVEPQKLTVIEGSYSMHPAFGRYYDLAIFLDIPPEAQRDRILKRNSPPLARRFFDEWIPMENAYFEGMAVRERAGLIHKGF